MFEIVIHILVFDGSKEESVLEMGCFHIPSFFGDCGLLFEYPRNKLVQFSETLP